MTAITRISPRYVASRLTEQVVLAVPRPADADALGAALRREGCEVFGVVTADEVRRLLRAGIGTMAVVATQLTDESGWLTCAKLQWSHPEVRVLLYGPDSPRNQRRAEFVGAAGLLTDAGEVVSWLRPVAGKIRTYH